MRFSCLVFILLLIGCSSVIEDPVEAYFEGTKVELLVARDSIPLERFGILRPQAITLHKDYLLIQKSCGSDFVSIIQPGRGVVINCIHKGRGPEETWLSPSGFSMHVDSLHLYDIARQRLLILPVEEIVASGKQALSMVSFPKDQDGYQVDMSKRLFVVASNNNRYYASGFLSGLWYAALDQDGNILGGLDYPDFEVLSGLSDAEKAAFCISTLFAVHPDGSRVAASLVSGAALSFACFQNNQLIEVKRLLFYPPEVASTGMEKGPALVYRSGNRRSCCHLRCDDNFVYYLYSGKPSDADSPSYEGARLYVFDWEGNPVKRYELSHTACDFVIDKGQLIGLSSYPSSTVYVYPFPADLSN